MSFVALISDLLVWWHAELAALRLRRGANDDNAVPTMRVSAKGVSQELETASCNEVGLEVGEGAAAGILATRRSAAILLETSACLERPLTPFRMPASRLAQMAAVDVAMATPIDPSSVYLLIEEPSACSVDNRYFIVRRIVLDPVLASLREQGKVLAGLTAETPSGSVALRPCPGGLAPRIPGTRRGKTLVLMLAVFFILVMGTFLRVAWRQATAAGAVESRIAALAPVVDEVRRIEGERAARLAELTRVRTQKRNALPVAPLLDGLAAGLPDEVWLTEFAVEDDRLRASGMAADGSRVLAMLEAIDGVSAAEFTAPVMRVPGAEGERFSVSARVGQ